LVRSRFLTNNYRIKHMADAEMTKFAKVLEKLSSDCGADVKKLLASCKSSIDSRMDKLKGDMEKIPAPNSPEAELDKAQALLNVILKQASSRFASICTMSVAIRIDKPGGKVSVPASGVSGPMATAQI
jgi:hypothetical protein